MRICKALSIFICVLALAETAVAQRTDSQIRADIQRRIGPVAGVTVAVQNGVVTLSGNIPNMSRKLSIGIVASRTVGVREVVNNLRVVPSKVLPDSQIAEAVRKTLGDNLSESEASAISVRVENGVVQLEGTLNSSYPKQLATTITSLVPGVTGISNEIVVKPRVTRTDAEILADVRKRYVSNPFVPENDITVNVDDGVVALTGTVKSFVQAEQAETIARFTPGVVDVRNRLFVSGR